MTFTPIIAKPPNAREFLNAVKKNFEKTGESAKKDFEATTSTWKHKPKFKIKVTEETGSVAFLSRKLTLFVGVESNYSKGKKATSNDIYRFVTRGTATRKVAMTADFVPKTKKGVIGSGPGKGGVARFLKHGTKGIEARDFEPVITRKNKPTIEKEMAKSFGLAAIKINWKL